MLAMKAPARSDSLCTRGARTGPPVCPFTRCGSTVHRAGKLHLGRRSHIDAVKAGAAMDLNGSCRKRSDLPILMAADR
jgi:hypothetical protein